MIEAEHLTKSFSYHTKEAGLKNTFRDFFFRKKTERQVVKDVSFHIDDGEIVGFLGPNGAGKTTTIKMLSGILHPTLGTARVLGEYTEMLDVGHVMNVQMRRLSLGERMKLEIIAALLHHPRVIFLDEPTIGLDIQAQKSIRNFIREYNRAEKSTILLTSHQMQDIEELCRRAVIISHGQLVYDGDLKEAGRFASGKKLMTLRLGREADPARLALWGNVRQDDGSAVVLEVDRSRVKEAAADLIAGLDILDFNIQDPPLEETLELLYSGKPEETVIMGYTFPQMMLYSVTATMSARFLATEVHSSVAQDIRDGALNRSLIQPVRYPLQKFCIFFGKKVFHFLVNMGILWVLLAVLWARGQASLRPWWVLCYFADLLPAYYLNFLIFLNISFLAFWLVEVSRIFGVISILLTIFSGGILPLDIFGAGVVEFLQNFPFFYTTYFLTNILTGRLNGGQMLQGAAIQAVWRAGMAAVEERCGKI